MRVTIVTMDGHLAGAAEKAGASLSRDVPGLALSIHAAADWRDDPRRLDACVADIGRADIVIVTMLFMEEHFQAVLPALKSRRDHCDAMVCAMSAGEVMRLTRMGRFSMDGSGGGPLALLRRLRGGKKEPADAADLDGDDGRDRVAQRSDDRRREEQAAARSTAGARQLRMLRSLPKMLRFIPGTAQDVRAYFLTLQYWLAGSEQNLDSLVRYLVGRYADGPRRSLRGRVTAPAPVEYPDVGLYHPRMLPRANRHPMLSDSFDSLPRLPDGTRRGRVGLLLMRSYLLAGNSAHYDAVIAAFERRGLEVVPAFATGLDSRPAIERFFLTGSDPIVDAVVSLTGFSLVGGPAYNDARAAEEILARLDVPYLSVTPVEFQTIAQWEDSDRGLLPVEATMMVAIPELDGATGPMVFGGRPEEVGEAAQRAAASATSRTAGSAGMEPHLERIDMLAARVDRMVALRQTPRSARRVAIVLFNFPPNAGNIGTASFLSVFESLHNTLLALAREGYTVDVPATVDALRIRIIDGNRERHGADANVAARISVDDHVRREPHLREIEAQWGPAPGRQQSDGASIFVLGERFGNVLVGIQPAFGYEGDPMRLLFEKGFAPTHAFSAFYRYLREDFDANAVLHFGTHGALEFMPGKQCGMSAACWPDRLIGDLPNLYLYAANNPSEGMIAKRRAAATLISYLTPPVTQAGLYRGLTDLKASLERWRAEDPVGLRDGDGRLELAALIRTQAEALDLGESLPAPGAEMRIEQLLTRVLEIEYALIPHGLHVVGKPLASAERIDLLAAVADASHGQAPAREVLQAIVNGASVDDALRAGALAADDAIRPLVQELADTDLALRQDGEIQGIVAALDGRFTRPAPGGDLLRTPAILPTGRNLHGFDPFRLPSAYAVRDGARQAERLIARHRADGHPLPESVAMVLWGTDNLKSEGGPIAQALALLGARPRFDSYGRLAGAELIPQAELKRPRIDVMITLSGIFRDLLPLQIKLLADAARLAAEADEPPEQNFVRKHALAFQKEHGVDLATAALRVFGNAEGAYGANVNHLVDNGRWEDGDELAETFTRRKGFAYGVDGQAVRHPALLQSVLAGVEMSYQNLDSVELGVTSIDTYFDTLGGISRAVKRAKGPGAAVAPVYIGDQTCGKHTVRTLSEQVALETRTRMLNPTWYEGMLKHGYEGVRQIEVHLTNTMGWSATTGQVQPWVYQQLTQTFMLDPQMLDRLSALNATASARVANRLLEASERQFWNPDPQMLAALRRAGETIEDRLEGVYEGAPA